MIRERINQSRTFGYQLPEWGFYGLVPTVHEDGHMPEMAPLHHHFEIW
jgi:hypothetical protein